MKRELVTGENGHAFNVRITRDQEKHIRNMSAEAGMSNSAYMRYLIKKDQERKEVSQEK